jgi:hypothetical protein
LLQASPEQSFLVHGGEVAKWRHRGVCNCKRPKLRVPRQHKLDSLRRLRKREFLAHL